MTPMLSPKGLLLASASKDAITGCGIPGSNYVEFQTGLGYVPGPPPSAMIQHGVDWGDSPVVSTSRAMRN